MKKKVINIKAISATVIILLMLNNLFMIPVVLSDENNTPPVVTDESPLNGSTGVSISQISVIIDDAEGDLFNWSIETSPDIGSINATGEGNGTKICPVSNLKYDTTYTWIVNATDGENSTSETFSFTTGSEPQKIIAFDIEDVYPTFPTDDEANYNPRLEVTISNYFGGTLDVTFRTNASGSWKTLGTLHGTNGIYTQHTSGMDINDTTYYWSVNITDGNDWENRTYSFVAQPFVLKWTSDPIADTTVGPLAVDVNDDGIYEVFATGEDKVACLNGITGEEIWSQTYSNIELHSPFEIYDLNNDGIEEIVISCRQTNGGWTIAYHANNGTEYWRVQLESGEKYLSIADIEGNGYPYVYICSGDPVSIPPESGRGRLRKLKGTTGEELVSVFTWRPCWGGPSIADANNDGNFEVYLTDRSTTFNFPANKLAKGMQCYDAQTLELIWYEEDVLCSSHGIALIDVNEDGVLDSVAFQQIGNGIYTIDGATGRRMPGKWGQSLFGLHGHSHFSIYDVDNDGHLELITARDSEAGVWDMGNWSLEAQLDVFKEPPKMADVIGGKQLEIIGAFSNVTIYNGTTYERIWVIPQAADGNTLVQDIDNDGQNELLTITGNGIVRAYDTSAYAPTPRVRTNSQYYSERNLGAGVYIPLPGAPQPILKEEYPANGSEYVEFNPTLSIHAIDFRYDLMNITISINATGSWVDVATFTDVGNDVYTYTPSNMNAIDTTYYWKVTAHDPYVDDLTTVETYHFKTVENTPHVSNPYPTNESIKVPVDTEELIFDLADYPAGVMEYSIETVPDVGFSGIITGVTDGTYTFELDPLSYFTNYKWYVNVTDGTYSTSKVYTFMTEPESLIADQEFDDSGSSSSLRSDGSDQDWYASYFSDQTLVTLDTSNIGGNEGNKVKFEGSDSDSVFLSQEFIQTQNEDFSVSWDVYVDEVIDIEDDPDRACFMFIGDDSDGINGPCSSDEDRFVYLAFVKDDGGKKGAMELRAYERYGSWNSFTIISDDLFLDTWYTIEVNVNFRLNRYTVYINGEHMRTIKPRTWKDELSHISFAQLSNGAGTFYIDNVFSPVAKRYRIIANAAPLTGGSIEISPGESTYAEGSSIQLNATANDGWVFYQWVGDVPSGLENENPLTVVMDNNKSINATFVDIESPVISDVQAIETATYGNVIISCNITDNEMLGNVEFNVELPNNDTINVPIASDDIVLTYDDFEIGWGNYTDGGFGFMDDCFLYTDGYYAHQGNNAAYIRDNSGSSSSFYHTYGQDIDTPGYQSLKVDFWFITENMTYDEEEDDRHNFWLSFYDGEIWHILEDYYYDIDFNNNEPYHKIVFINETDYNFSSDAKITFQCDAFNDSQHVYIDQIYVNATKLSNHYYNRIYNQTGTYYYYIWADDTTGNSNTSPIYNFTISIIPFPVLSNPIPTNSAINVELNPTLSIHALDHQGDLMNIQFRTNASGSWQTIYSENGGNKTYNTSTGDMNNYNTRYYWSVNCTDGDHWTNETYFFTTEPNDPPEISNILPYNGETSVPISLSELEFELSDDEGDTMEYYVTTSPDIGSGSEIGVGGGTKTINVNDLSYSTLYTWYVNVKDSSGSSVWTNETYSFTTRPKPAAWWNLDWPYRKEIIIDQTKVAGALSNFPALVSISSDSGLADHSQNDGDDIVFVAYDGNKLNHEIEQYNGITGQLTAWVNIPALSTTTDTIFYMYYGNSSADNQENKNSTWDSNYLAVHHFSETSEQHQDSTSNNNDSTNLELTSQGATGGIVNRCDVMDGSDDFIQFPNKKFAAGKEELTVELWINPDELTGANTIYDEWNADNSWQYSLRFDGYYTRDSSTGSSGTRNNDISWSTLPSIGSWNYVATWYSVSANEKRIYLNGAINSFTSVSIDQLTSDRNSDSPRIGHASDGDNFDGRVDEFRVSKIARSNNWIKTTYNTISSPNTFLSIGTESTPPQEPGLSSENPSNGATNINLNPTLSIKVVDYQKDTMNITFKMKISGNWQTIGSFVNVKDGTYNIKATNMNQYSITYYWSVNCTDGVHWTNQSYSFTTRSAPGGGGDDPGTGGGGTVLPPQPSKPVADAKGPYTGFIGEEIEFDGSDSTAHESIENYTWTFGDGETDYGVKPIHIYSSPGTYKVKLTVEDNYGATDEDETTAVIVTPNTIPSVPVVTGPQKGTKNKKYTYIATSTDEDNDTIQYNFDWDDGTSNTTEFLPSGDATIYIHMWTSAGKYTISVQAYDNQTPSTIARYTVLIDAIMIDDNTYLTDEDADGIYDKLHNGTIEIEIELIDGKYLLDINDDGEYDKVLDSETNEVTDYESPTKITDEDYTVPILIIAALIIIVVIIIVIIKFKKPSKK